MPTLPAIPWLPVLTAAGGFLAALGFMAGREWNRRLVLKRVLSRRPVGSDGVVPGAHTVSRPGGVARGALVLHGYADTPQSVVALCDALARAGYAVEAPLLPGHGRTLASLDRATERQWIAEARAAWLAMRSRHGTCVLVGQSMGGALAVLLAAEAPPAALVLAAPYVSATQAIARAVRWSRLWGLWMPYVETADPRSIRDPEALIASRGYGAATAKSMRALHRLMTLARAALPRVSCPTMLVQSPDDNRVSAAGAEWAFARLGAAATALVGRPGAGHVVLADRGRDAGRAAAVQWCQRFAGPARPGGKSGDEPGGASRGRPVRLTS
ncbi:MAG: alpha/beta hydrolase [Gemmatimonadota bacterium]